MQDGITYDRYFVHRPLARVPSKQYFGNVMSSYVREEGFLLRWAYWNELSLTTVRCSEQIICLFCQNLDFYIVTACCIFFTLNVGDLFHFLMISFMIFTSNFSYCVEFWHKIYAFSAQHFFCCPAVQTMAHSSSIQNVFC